MNPLMQSSAPPTMQATQGPTSPNPMMPSQQPAQGAPQPTDPASVIQSLNLSPQQMAKQAALATYSAQELGKLAKNPDLGPKDVVNATGQAVADGQITTSDAVKFLSTMPQDEAQLRPWVNQLYMHNLVASVHLKAALMKGGAQ